MKGIKGSVGSLGGEFVLNMQVHLWTLSYNAEWELKFADGFSPSYVDTADTNLSFLRRQKSGSAFSTQHREKKNNISSYR